jgi:hypothetical protein
MPADKRLRATVCSSKASVWLPVRGTWIWRHDQAFIVSCVDDTCDVFRDAVGYCQEVFGLTSSESIQKVQLPRSIQAVCAEANFEGDSCKDVLLYQLGNHEAVGLGRDRQHRFRAACLGLALSKILSETLRRPAPIPQAG